MSTITRLQTESPELDRAFSHAATATQRRVLYHVCRHAVSAFDLDKEQDVAQSLLMLEAMNKDDTLKQRAESLAAALDEKYFRLSGKRGAQAQMEAALYFSRARAATALTYALSSVPTDGHEALYEAIKAFDDPEPIIAMALRGLG